MLFTIKHFRLIKLYKHGMNDSFSICELIVFFFSKLIFMFTFALKIKQHVFYFPAFYGFSNHADTMFEDEDDDDEDGFLPGYDM